MKNRIRNSLLAAAFTCALIAGSALAGETLDKAFDAFKAGDWAEARSVAASVEKGDADYAKARYLVGECALQSGEHAAAAEAFRAVLAHNAKAVPALTGLGRALTAGGEHEAAEEALVKAADLDPKDAAPRRAMGDLFVAREDLKQARKEFAAAHKLDSRDPENVRALVACDIELGEEKAAQKIAAQFAKAQPKHPLGHFLLGWVADRANEPKDAIRAYEKAIELDDTFIDAHKNLAIMCVANNPTYQDLERTKKALQHFKRYFELGGKDARLEQLYKTIDSVLPDEFKGGAK